MILVNVIFNPEDTRVYTYNFVGAMPKVNQLVLVDSPSNFKYGVAKVVAIGGEELLRNKEINLKNAYADFSTMRTYRIINETV
jgi:hypothetical protein